MKSKIYYLAYKIHFSWFGKMVLSILFYSALQSMILCHNIFADQDPRTLYDQMNGVIEIQVTHHYPNGNILIIYTDGSQTLDLGDGAKILRDSNGIVEIKAEGHHARFKDTYIAIATKMQGPFSWTDISNTLTDSDSVDELDGTLDNYAGQNFCSNRSRDYTIFCAYST